MAQWIEDTEARRQITSSVKEHVRKRQKQRKTPPKNPDYWLSRTINSAFRKELQKHAIAPPNTFTEEVYDKIKQLVRGRVPRYLEDAAVRNVFERYRTEVEPIQNLEHWANSVIPDACTDAIREETSSARRQIDVEDAEVEMLSLFEGTGTEEHSDEWIDLIVRAMSDDVALSDSLLRALAEHFFECFGCCNVLRCLVHTQVHRHCHISGRGESWYKHGLVCSPALRQGAIEVLYMVIRDARARGTWSPAPRLVQYFCLGFEQRLFRFVRNLPPEVRQLVKNVGVFPCLFL